MRKGKSSERSGATMVRLRALDIPTLFITLYCYVFVAALGEVPGAFILPAALLTIPGLVLSRRPVADLYRRVWNITSCLFIAAMLAAHVMLSVASDAVLVSICLFLMLHKWYNPRGTKEHLELWCLSALVMMVGALKGTGALGLLLSIGWAVASCQLFNLMAVLKRLPEVAPGHQDDSAYVWAPQSLRGVWGLAPLSLLLAAGIFCLAPRLQTFSIPELPAGTPTPAERSVVRSGFSGSVNLRSMSNIKETAGVALRVIDPPRQIEAQDFRLRITPLDLFDGWEWRRTAGPAEVPPERRGPALWFPPFKNHGSTAVLLDRFVIRLMDITGPMIPLPESAVGIEGVPPSIGLTLGEDGDLSVSDSRTLREYVVLAHGYARLPTNQPLMRGAITAAHTEVPESLRPILEETASQVIPPSAKNPTEMARAVHTWLRRTGTYTMDVGYLDDGPEAIRQFLGTSLSGHCELFATSMALILRTRGVPTRIVTGFAGAEAVPSSIDPAKRDFLVMHRNAHAWVEVFIQGSGWVSYDPTPAAVLTTTPSTAGAGSALQIWLRDTSGSLVAMIDGYDYRTQRQTVEKLRARISQAITGYDHGILPRTWDRFRNNIVEPPILLLIAGLALLNIGAIMLFRGRIATRLRGRKHRAGKTHREALLEEILATLEVPGSDRRPTRLSESPRESILAGAAGATSLDVADRVRAIAALYDEWRWCGRQRTTERRIRESLSTLRRERAVTPSRRASS